MSPNFGRGTPNEGGDPSPSRQDSNMEQVRAPPRGVDLMTKTAKRTVKNVGGTRIWQLDSEGSGWECGRITSRTIWPRSLMSIKC